MDYNILRFTCMVIKIFIREYEADSKWLIFPFYHNNTNPDFGSYFIFEKLNSVIFLEETSPLYEGYFIIHKKLLPFVKFTNAE